MMAGSEVGTVAGGTGGAIVGSHVGREVVKDPPPLSITVKPSPILFLK